MNDLPPRLEAQRAACRQHGAPDRAARLADLGRLETALRANTPALADAIAQDFGHRVFAETVLAEIMPVRAAIAHARRHLARWMRPQPRRLGWSFRPGRAWVQFEPLGCIGIVAPWNYPLLLSLMPLVDALAAGNRVLLKPSEHAPVFARCLAAMLAEIFDPAQLAVVQGDAATSRDFCALPFDHLLFTGSTDVGRAVMRAAAENLTPVTLELGGKSPVILAPDHDPARAAHTVAVGKFFSAGQTCLAPDYALVPADRVDAFAGAVIAAARRFYPHIIGNLDYTAIISDRHWARLNDALDEARAAGARVLQLESAPAERRLGPAVVIDPPPDGALMREEIFGPILPVIGCRSLDDAIAFAASRPRPLALYPFTRNHRTMRRILAGIPSGGVTWNGTILHAAMPDLPFGGAGASGMGAYHGRAGFERLSHARAIYKPGWFSGFTWMTPPHGRFSRLALQQMLRR